MIHKFTATDAENIYEKAITVVSSDKWYEILYKITGYIRSEYMDFMSYGGGRFQPETRLISYTHNAMKKLNFEMTDINVFMAANAMQSFVMNNYNSVPFPEAPDYNLYKSYEGAAHIMNMIITYDKEGWEAIN